MTMLSTGSFFRFSFSHSLPGDERRSYAMAYKPPGPMRAGALQELILDVCRGPNLPDCVVVVGLKEDTLGKLLETLGSDSVAVARQRIAGRIPLIYCGLSLKTASIEVRMLDPAYSKQRLVIERVLKSQVESWMKAGLITAFPIDDVLLKAPPGYAYQKPSGSRSSLFLKPDLGLKSSATVGFVAAAVFNRLYSGKITRLSELQTVFVDTMAISPVAYGLAELMALCGYKHPFAIESFHSYGGFEDVGRPLAGTSLCLISASTSMSMHKRWVAEKQVAPHEVMTLVTIAPVKAFQDGALLNLGAIKQSNVDSDQAQLSIRIKGETFLPEHEVAKKVLLNEIAHRFDVDTKWFREFAGEGVFDIYRRPAYPGSKPRALFVDGSKLLQQDKFSDWLVVQLVRRVKASTRLIIHQDDLASKQLAALVQKICQSELGLPALSLVSLSDLAEEPISENSGVIVCGAVVGKGSQILEASRALRDKHKGARLYIIGYQITETCEELATLPMNLRHDKSVQHDVARFAAAAVGRPLLSSYADEIRALYPSGLDANSLPGGMSKRAIILGGTAPIGKLSLLPHGHKVEGHMRLREGFAFWRDGYPPSAFQAEAVATIAVVLQRAREERSLPDASRLASSTYRHVVLDPENFARFNDGVLQAALLRCAFPSELDYRADHASSDFIKGVIARALRRAADEAGEGLLEFLMALSTRRLQLADVHFNELKDLVRAHETSETELKRAIQYVLLPLEAQLFEVKNSPI